MKTDSYSICYLIPSPINRHYTALPKPDNTLSKQYSLTELGDHEKQITGNHMVAAYSNSKRKYFSLNEKE